MKGLLNTGGVGCSGCMGGTDIGTEMFAEVDGCCSTGDSSKETVTKLVSIADSVIDVSGIDSYVAVRTSITNGVGCR